MNLQEGIIIKTIPYQDASKIITLITKEGKKSLIAKGAAKLKSHHFSHSQELSKISFEEKNKYLAQTKLMNFYSEIRENGSKLKSAMIILELTNQIADHVTDFSLFYQFLDEILSLINSPPPEEKLYELIFRLKTLYLLGISPVFNQCVECGSKVNLVGFSFYNGGMKCDQHFSQEDYLYELSTVKSIQFLYKMKLFELQKIAKEIVFDYQKLDSFLSHYYEYFLGFRSKGSKILKRFEELFDKKSNM
ncbi:MAG: DNA repair protein RecO [Bacilli bacterium]|jgi:DNA repair protein RecO (recombination protein O)|nr:DNA repair protein RecO [Bacilli bacterium]